MSGCAEEQTGFYHRFSAIILLSVSKEVMIARIQARADHGFGHRPDEMDHVIKDLDEIDPLLRKRCTHEIDATVSIDSVVDQILEITCPTRCSGRADARH